MSRTVALLSMALLLATDLLPAMSAEPEIVVGGLKNPCGVAVHAESGDVFVSNSGEGQVLRILPAEIEKSTAAVVGFAKDIYGKGPMYDIGPLGLVLVNHGRELVVGGGDQVDGKELVRAYPVISTGETLNVGDHEAWSAGPIAPGDQSSTGEGNFYGLAANAEAIFITCNGDDTKGWVSKIELAGDNAHKLVPFIATKVATQVDAPVGIAIGPGGEVVVGQMGEITVPNDSLLTFYDAKTGELLANLEAGLFDICALAYHPTTGKLYGLDFAWMDTAEGGLFRLDFDREKGTCEAVKILSLDKPTALAFAPDGTLYITVIGTAEDGDAYPPGALLRVVGDL